MKLLSKVQYMQFFLLALSTQNYFIEQGRPLVFTTQGDHLVSHIRFTRRRATLVPPSRGVHEPRGCCDDAPALICCGPLQRRPPTLGP